MLLWGGENYEILRLLGEHETNLGYHCPFDVPIIPLFNQSILHSFVRSFIHSITHVGNTWQSPGSGMSVIAQLDIFT